MRCAANGKGSDSCHLTCGSFLLSRFRFEAYHVILSFQLEPRGKLRVHHYLFFQMLISHPCFLHGSLRNLHRLPSIPTTDPSPRIASMIPNPTSFPSLHSIQPQHNPNTTPPPRTRIRIPTFVAFVAQFGSPFKLGAVPAFFSVQLAFGSFLERIFFPCLRFRVSSNGRTQLESPIAADDDSLAGA